LQASTYFTLSLAGEALMHIGGNFSREYFLERVEHAAENALASSVYPRMSLGPEQRFASKGCYILRFSQAAKGGWSAATDWIAP